MTNAKAASAIVGLYRRHAQAWARVRGRTLVERPWLDRFCDLLPDHPSVLDIGCGSGEPIARALVERSCRVMGVDASPEMIALFQRNLPDQASMVADMRRLSVGHRFQGLLAWNSFFHLSPAGQRAMFPIFRRHAAPGAVLMFTSGAGHGEAMGTFEGEPLYHASLDSDEYRRLLEGQGFEVVAHVVDDPDCGGHTIWLSRLRRETAAVPA